MKASTYKKRVAETMRQLGIYNPGFDAAISSLAELCESRDQNMDLYQTIGGGAPVIKHTNKAGATNVEKNPYLVIIEKQDALILKYRSELGLTPRGLLRIDKKALKKRPVSALESALRDALDQ